MPTPSRPPLCSFSSRDLSLSVAHHCPHRWPPFFSSLLAAQRCPHCHLTPHRQTKPFVRPPRGRRECAAQSPREPSRWPACVSRCNFWPSLTANRGLLALLCSPRYSRHVIGRARRLLAPRSPGGLSSRSTLSRAHSRARPFTWREYRGEQSRVQPLRPVPSSAVESVSLWR